MTKKQSYAAIITLLLFFALVLGVVVTMNVRSTAVTTRIMTESAEGQLLALAMSARALLNAEDVMAYEDADVASLPAYQATLSSLRNLRSAAGAEYIYVLKPQGSEFVFVFDTDDVDTEIFIPYELEEVHTLAFQGRPATKVIAMEDVYGSFSTGAVPLYYQGRVVAVVAVDMDDQSLANCISAANTNSMILVGILVVIMAVLFVLTMKLLRRLRGAQDQLYRQAHYDTITGLPNRQYLMEYLTKITASTKKEPFALFFIDLDNFKRVNDNAGHDAGDELLRSIGEYLGQELKTHKPSMVFRPPAGQLNVAARVGGDEFIQIVPGVETTEQAEHLAQLLLDGFQTQPHFGRYIEKYQVGMSLGIALYPNQSSNYHVLIKYADAAMYVAKRNGKNQYAIYTDEMNAEVADIPQESSR